MKEQAIVDRFEGDFIILETDHGMIQIPPQPCACHGWRGYGCLV